MLGIAARNVILLIARYQRLERHEGEAFGRALVLRGTRDRSVPVVLSAAATGAAFLPFVLFGDIAGHEILHPMAVVVLGGLVTSTLLGLLVTPVLYLRFGSGAAVDLTLRDNGLDPRARGSRTNGDEAAVRPSAMVPGSGPHAGA